MPYNSRDPGAGSTSASQFPISRGFAVTILVALGVIVLLRHLYGSVSVEAGAR